jgi:hypothetical protein
VGKHRYQITVDDGLDEAGREAFEGFKIEPDGRGTMLVADLDQAGLFGALDRIQALGLGLVELIRVADGRAQGRRQGNS